MGQAMQGVPPSGAGHSACCARRTVGAEGNVLAWKCGSSIQVPEDINNTELCCDNTSQRLPAQCCQPKSRSSLKTLKMTCLMNELGAGSMHSMSHKACHHSQCYFFRFYFLAVSVKRPKTPLSLNTEPYCHLRSQLVLFVAHLVMPVAVQHPIRR